MDLAAVGARRSAVLLLAVVAPTPTTPHQTAQSPFHLWVTPTASMASEAFGAGSGTWTGNRNGNRDGVSTCGPASRRVDTPETRRGDRWHETHWPDGRIETDLRCGRKQDCGTRTAGVAPAEDELVMSISRRTRFEPPVDARTILTQRGFNLTQAERASGLSRGSLSRILAGRRCGLRLETVRRLSRGTRIPLGKLVEALETSITSAQERAERRRRAQEAIDAARCG